MPHPTDEHIGLANQFFDVIRRPNVDRNRLESVHQQILEVCPQVTNFSFEMVESEGTSEQDVLKGESGLYVETGTPQSVVDSWNSDKLVGLFAFDPSAHCGAAIGAATTGDFKACALLKHGESKCEIQSHALARTQRIDGYSGEITLVIPIPHSSGGISHLFSRPKLTEEELRLLDVPLGSKPYNVLMQPGPSTSGGGSGLTLWPVDEVGTLSLDSLGILS